MFTAPAAPALLLPVLSRLLAEKPPDVTVGRLRRLRVDRWPAPFVGLLLAALRGTRSHHAICLLAEFGKRLDSPRRRALLAAEHARALAGIYDFPLALDVIQRNRASWRHLPARMKRIVKAVETESLMRLGRHADAEMVLQGSGATDRETVKARVRLARRHNPEAALGMVRQALARQRRPDLLLTNIAADILVRLKRDAEAEALLLSGAGAGDVDLLPALVNMARERDRPEEAASWLRQFYGRYGLHVPDPDKRGLPGIPNDPKPARQDGPLVTVVMTAYNTEQHVGPALRSILAQTYRNLEVLVVDDASVDGTRRVIEEVGHQDRRVRMFVNKRNIGTYAAKNRALAEARGAFITCHDSDDWAHPERIARHVALMRQAPRLVATYSYWMRIDEAGRFVLQHNGRFLHTSFCSLFFRREVLDDIGYFDPVRFSADAEFMRRLAAVYGAGRLREMREPLALGFRRGGSLTASGAGGYDADGYSPHRAAYWSASSRWHVQCLKKGVRPCIGLAPTRRLFAVPPECLSGSTAAAPACPAPAEGSIKPRHLERQE